MTYYKLIITYFCLTLCGVAQGMAMEVDRVQKRKTSASNLQKLLDCRALGLIAPRNFYTGVKESQERAKREAQGVAKVLEALVEEANRTNIKYISSRGLSTSVHAWERFTYQKKEVMTYLSRGSLVWVDEDGMLIWPESLARDWR